MENQLTERFSERFRSLGEDPDKEFIRSEIFDRVVRQFVNEQSLTPVELSQLVQIAADQQGRWDCEWSFSPSSNPNLDAHKEASQYKKLWMVLAESLVNVTPQIKETMIKQRDLLGLKYCLKRRVEQTQHNRVATLVNVTIYKIARALFLLGFTAVGEKLYAISLYPRGTIGRTT